MAFLGVKRTIHHLIVAGRLKGVIALVSLECWAVVIMTRLIRSILIKYILLGIP